MRVVDLLEVIEIEHQQRERGLVPARELELAVEPVEEVALVEQLASADRAAPTTSGSRGTTRRGRRDTRTAAPWCGRPGSCRHRGAGSAARASWPLTNVPLRLSRSSTHSASPSRRSRAWWRDIPSSSSRISALAARPITRVADRELEQLAGRGPGQHRQAGVACAAASGRRAARRRRSRSTCPRPNLPPHEPTIALGARTAGCSPVRVRRARRTRWRSPRGARPGARAWPRSHGPPSPSSRIRSAAAAACSRNSASSRSSACWNAMPIARP